MYAREKPPIAPIVVEAGALASLFQSFNKHKLAKIILQHNLQYPVTVLLFRSLLHKLLATPYYHDVNNSTYNISTTIL